MNPSGIEILSSSTQVSLAMNPYHRRRQEVVLPTVYFKDSVCEADVSQNFLLKFVLRNEISIKDSIGIFPFQLSLSNTRVDFLPVLCAAIFAYAPSL